MAKYKSEFKGVAQFLEGEWENLLKQVENAERKQRDVMRSKSVNEVELRSNKTRNILESHRNDVFQFRSKFFSKVDELQKSWEYIFGNQVENTESSSLNHGAPTFQKLISNKKKKRVLEGVTKRLVKHDTDIFTAVYNSSTKEIFSHKMLNNDIIVLCINETSREIEVKRELSWRSLRGTEGGVNGTISDIAMDGRNTLYGIIWRSSDHINRLEVLDQNNLAKIGQLDTCGIENGRGFYWEIVASGDTFALAIKCNLPDYCSKWMSVTLFKNQRRQNTISLNIVCLEYTTSLFLSNEQILLLSCDKEIAVVWLPPLSTPGSISDSSSAPNSSSETQSLVSVKATNQLLSGVTVDPRAVKFIKLPIDEKITSIVWIASDDMPSFESLEGYLFVSEQCPNFNTTLHVFKVDLEKVLSTNEHEREMTLHHMSEITSLKDTEVLCPITNSKIVARVASRYDRGRIVLLDLEYQNVP